MSKKKLFAMMALVIVIAILGTGTLAYFTTKAVVHNVITTGEIDIALVEKMVDKDGNVIDYVNNSTGLMPGQSHSKIVKIRNEGTNPAWVRLKVEIDIAAENGQSLDDSALAIDYNTDTWLKKDGVFYYKQPLAPGETTTALFEEVEFAQTTGNAYQNARISIQVNAEAIQYENNTNFDTAWPADVEILKNVF